jgi:peptidoglycan/LPS O-acetylase OafA/YrhL
MGMMRVLLAIAVVLGHVGGLGGYMLTGGPVAVQAFYIISGFYMGLVLNERYDRPALNGVFYANRAIRIYALYFFFLALYLAVMIVVQLSTGGSPLSRYVTDTVPAPEKAFLALLNLTIIGQDLTFHLAIEQGRFVWTGHPFALQGDDVFLFMIIPMAWSLALEIYFYALAPFVARRPAWQIAVLLAVSLAARIVAAACGLTQDPYSYRFFPFELALFLAGVLGYKAWAAAPDRWQRQPARLLALAVPAAVFAYPWLQGSWPAQAFFTPPRLGVLLLVGIGLPAIHAWTRNWTFDRAVGELSYPLYLSHFLVAAVIPAGGVLALWPSAHALAVLLASLALSWLVARHVDRGVEHFRRRLATRAGVKVPKGGDIGPGFA